MADDIQEMSEDIPTLKRKTILGDASAVVSIDEILLAPNFKQGDCVPEGKGEDGGRRCGEPISKHQPLQSSASEGTLGGGGERASDLGDKLFIYGGYRDKFLYLYGSQTSVRISF